MTMREWDIVKMLKLFFFMVIMLLLVNVILGNTSELHIYWKSIALFSLLFSIFSVKNYKTIEILMPIEDKDRFSIYLRNYLESSGLKIIDESNDVFILRPKYYGISSWVSNERTTVALEENQVVLTGPSLYVEKIRILLNANL